MPSGHTGGDFEMFDAPGEYVTFSDGQTYSQIRLEEFHAEHQVVRGDADARGISSGYTMELTDHPNDGENGRYLIRGTNNGVSALVNHRGQITARTEQFVETTLTGEVEVMLGKTPFGSFGSLPVIAGCGVALTLMLLMYLGFWRDSD